MGCESSRAHVPTTLRRSWRHSTVRDYWATSQLIASHPGNRRKQLTRVSSCQRRDENPLIATIVGSLNMTCARIQWWRGVKTHFLLAAATLLVGSAPSHLTSAVGPYVDGTFLLSNR